MQDYKHIRYNLENPPKNSAKKVLGILLLFVIIVTPFVYNYQKYGSFLIKEETTKLPVMDKVTEVEVNVPDRFTYFQILAKGESIIQDKDIPQVDVPSSKIYLQLAAFKTAAEADNFEAQLRLLDLTPKVETLFAPNKGGNWFTVRLGAIETDEELARLKLILDSNQIKFAVVTRN